MVWENHEWVGSSESHEWFGKFGYDDDDDADADADGWKLKKNNF